MFDATFKALGDPTRRAILRLLRDRDMVAGDIAAQFPMAWASVSRHLQVLRDADLVLATREGQYIRYSLNTTVFQDAIQHLAELLPGRHHDAEARDA